ncbi:MAG: hypothetical protein ABJA20_00830 [Novosphingobium sp.]
MTVRQIVWAWLAALLIAAAAVVAVRMVAPPERPFFDRAQIAVVGSSLMRGAVSPFGPDARSPQKSLLGDGRPHARIGMIAAEEWQLIAMANQAVARKVSVLFIEVNPLIRDLPAVDDEHLCDMRQAGLRHWLKFAQFRIANDFHSGLGLKRIERRGDEDPEQLFDAQKITPEDIKRMYPQQLHDPYCRQDLDAMMRNARDNGVQVVMVLPPHSRAAEAVQSRAVVTGLRTRAGALAARYSVPLFAPQGPWDNAEFYDLAHMNIKGRAHFQAELAAWWRS